MQAAMPRFPEEVIATPFGRGAVDDTEARLQRRGVEPGETGRAPVGDQNVAIMRDDPGRLGKALQGRDMPAVSWSMTSTRSRAVCAMNTRRGSLDRMRRDRRRIMSIRDIQ